MQIASRQAQSILTTALRASIKSPVALISPRSSSTPTPKQAFHGSVAGFRKLPLSFKGVSSYTTMALFGATATKETFYDYKVTDADGKAVDLSKYKGKIVLIVNVASQCGFTPQYKELAALYDKYSSQGLVILGFPCNQFGGQEPGTNDQVKKFAQDRGAKFPIMAKVDVNGSNEDPLFGFLKSMQGGLLTKDIKWNFTKFLINRDGEVVKRYGSATTPMSIEDDIKKLL